MAYETATAKVPFGTHPEIARLFPDLHPPFATKQAAALEADRCLNCFDAPCTAACPTHIDVPRFIKKIASGNVRGSANSILEANVLAASCSRVCPVQVLCEGACVMHHDARKPIEIARLQRFAMDTFHSSGGKLARKFEGERAGKVACVGAGPASLAAAAELKQQGFSVTVFDKRPLPGGLNTYGVAEYKLPTEASLREIELIAELGVEFRYEAAIEEEAALERLEAEFDFIFLGAGWGAMHRLALPGGDHPGVVDALRLIEEYKLGSRTRIDGRVFVIGAGNTAIDAAIAAKRLGASEVRILYRRTEALISAFDFEYEHAKAEGVRFEWLVQPVALHAEGDKLKAIECVRMEIDRVGGIAAIEGSNFEVACEMVIPAIGQSPLLEFLAKCRGVSIEKGRVVIDRATGQTTNPKYFAGGDCVNGGREVVDAVADGKRAGVGMTALLEAAYA